MILNGKTDTIGKVSASGEWFRLLSEENNSIAQEYKPEDIQYARMLTVSFNGNVWHDVALCREDYTAPKEATALPSEVDAVTRFVVEPNKTIIAEDSVTTVSDVPKVISEVDDAEPV